MASQPPIAILVDADACPVKEEIYRVAARHRVPVAIVSNSPFRVPASPLVTRVMVSDAFDAADDWIAARAHARTVVITGDILLADRCVKAGALVLAHNGRPFDAASIGGAIATRAIMADLRAGMDGIGGGPAPFSKADRSRFLQSLDQALVRLARQVRVPGTAAARPPLQVQGERAMADKQPTQGMAPNDGHKGDPGGTAIPTDTRGAGDGGPVGPKDTDGFHGGQSGAAYHGHGRLGDKKVDGQENANGVSDDP